MFLVFFSTSLCAQVGLELQMVVSEFETAYNKADDSTLGKMFTTNAILINTDGTTITGAKNIGDSYGAIFKTATMHNQMKITNTIIENDTKAIVVGTFKITGTDLQTGDTIEINGNFDNTYLKDNNIWTISRMKMIKL